MDAMTCTGNLILALWEEILPVDAKAYGGVDGNIDDNEPILR